MRRERALKNRVDLGGITLYRDGLSLGAVCEARASIGDDDEPLRDARYFLDNGSAGPIGESQPDCFHGMVELRPRCRDVVPSFSKSDRTRGTDRVGCARRHRCSVDLAGSGKAVTRPRIGSKLEFEAQLNCDHPWAAVPAQSHSQ